MEVLWLGVRMANTNVTIGDRPAGVFKTYPEFSKLTLGDRKKYEALIRDYPPMSEYSFPTLMNWWNTLDSCAVATLNGNLVISYWLPGGDRSTGISVVGVNDVDATMCAVLDELKRNGETPRLVHVPEFVVSHMSHPELFNFKSERAYDEYVLDLNRYYPMKRMKGLRRHRIRRFLSSVGDAKIVVKSIDLADEDNQRMLLGYAKAWPRRGTVNALVKHSDDAMKVSIENAEILGTENICLMIDGEIHAFLLYTQPSDSHYAIFSHVMVRYDVPYVYDYLAYAFAEWLLDRGIRYLNLDSDLGVPMLRVLKLALGPCNYFRKYTVTPV